MIGKEEAVKNKEAVGNNSPWASIDSKFTHHTQPIPENTQTIPEKGSGPDGRYFPFDPDILSKKQTIELINEINEEYKVNGKYD